MTTGPTDPNQTPPPPSGAMPPPAPPAPFGQPPYDQSQSGQPQSGQQSYAQPAYGQQPYGQPQPYGYGVPGYVAPVPNDGMAIGAMVVGIVSIVLACGYGIGLLGSPVALVLGRISLKRIDSSDGRLGGRAMAMAGFVLGIVGTILLVLAIAAVVVVVILAMNGTFDDSSSNY